MMRVEETLLLWRHLHLHPQVFQQATFRVRNHINRDNRVNIDDLVHVVVVDPVIINPILVYSVIDDPVILVDMIAVNQVIIIDRVIIDLVVVNYRSSQSTRSLCLTRT